ncbi:MAG: bifunctional folylpolyglutamate synthase/dihydrofolate synthase [Deltaproteobacteria bacterium]|nr:bifunctional folylpolyglutamate synthase/dihydrofolate synthase [Deltaproteobacteria bacterium]
MLHSYQESLEYLYALQFFGIKLGLDNIRELLSCVGNPQESLRIIHIAGTNGKGSTAAALASMFQAAGIPAGLYTSPHLHNFSERIRIDTQQIGEAEVVSLIEELRPHAERLRATFFEFTTAMALLSFQRHGTSWAILETGMGGRLDATNAVNPELCLLTSIDLDHTEYLGNNLAAVAAEKAGIFKSGVPVISVRQKPEVAAVLQSCAERLAVPLLGEGAAYRWATQGAAFNYFGPACMLENIQPALLGNHQRQNLALAVAAMEQLMGRGLRVSCAQMKEGIEKVCWPGRLEWLTGQVLVDGAHNPAGADVLVSYLQQERLKDLHLVIGCKADKTFTELLLSLLPFASQVYATSPPVDEAVAPEKLVQLAQESGILASPYVDPATALKAALENCRPGSCVLVTGSLFLVAAVRELLLPETDPLKIVI